MMASANDERLQASSRRSSAQCRFSRALVSCLVVFVMALPARAVEGVIETPLYDKAIDSPMYRNPDTPSPPTVVIFSKDDPTQLSRELKRLWEKALDRPEAEIRCRAADSIVQAHRRGAKGLETFIAPLRAALDRANQHPAVQVAAARALIALEARETAPSLLRVARAGGIEMRNLVEPALAKWDYQPAGEVWLERLREREPLPRSLVLAVRGLGEVGEIQAADRLHAIVLSGDAPAPLRLEAARALGKIRPDGLEKDADRLAADS